MENLAVKKVKTMEPKRFVTLKSAGYDFAKMAQSIFEKLHNPEGLLALLGEPSQEALLRAIEKTLIQKAFIGGAEKLSYLVGEKKYIDPTHDFSWTFGEVAWSLKKVFTITNETLKKNGKYWYYFELILEESRFTYNQLQYEDMENLVLSIENKAKYFHPAISEFNQDKFFGSRVEDIRASMAGNNVDIAETEYREGLKAMLYVSYVFSLNDSPGVRYKFHFKKEQEDGFVENAYIPNLINFSFYPEMYIQPIGRNKQMIVWKGWKEAIKNGKMSNIVEAVKVLRSNELISELVIN
jgi:hypothetical protein